MLTIRGGRVGNSKGREDHDLRDPLEVKTKQADGRTTVLRDPLEIKNEQEDGRTTVFVILLRLKIGTWDCA